MTGTLRPRLVLTQGARTLGTWEILPGEDWTLGRQPESPIPLAERSISRLHARIFCDAAGVHLEDLGTPNGTFVDDRPVTGVVTLRDGETVRLGQSTNPVPLLLRFEDPASRLLEGLAVEPPVPSPPPAAAAAAGAAPAAVSPAPIPAPEPMPGAEAKPTLAVDEGKDTMEPGAASAPPEPPPEEEGVPAGSASGGLLARVPWRLALPAVAAVLLVGWLLSQGLEFTQKPWRSVRVEPRKMRAGGRVAISGSEVEPSETLKVFVDDRAAAVERMTAGEVVFVVPALPAAEAGVRPAALRVERGGIDVLKQAVQVETVPEVAELVPPDAHVGETVTLRGSGFVTDPARVRIRVGHVVAPVLSATPEQIQFRVPVVTRNVVVELPLQVQVADWAAPARSLQVRPREAPCIDFTFTPRYAAQGVWEVRHPFGAAAYLEGPPPDESGSPPPPVRQSAEALRAAFEKAAADPTVRFEVRDSGRGIVAVGVASRPLEVARWSPALVGYLRERAPELRQAELLPFWGSVVLNELLNTFAKKQRPRLLPAGAPLRRALERVSALNLDTGGQGCPTAVEMETLTAEERDAFENAVASIPNRFGEVSGAWEGSLENVFAEGPTDTALELRLELEQTGTLLKAKATVSQVRGPGIRWSPPPIDGIEGRVKLGGETRIELTVPPGPPFHFTRLSAVVKDDALDGTFVTSKGKRGRFQLAYRPEP
jgi:hypothetical protein